MITAPARDLFLFFTSAPRRVTNVRLVRGICSVIILFRCTTGARYLDVLWGPEGVALPAGFPEPHAQALATLFASRAATYLLGGGLVVSALALLAGFAERTATLGCIVLASVFNHRLPELCDGGDGLLRLVLLFSLLCQPSRTEHSAPGLISRALHNCGIALLYAQALLMYFAAGLAKASSQQWTNGTATYLISHAELYCPSMVATLFQFPVIATLTATGVTIFQLLLPAGIFTRWRLLFLGGAAAFHAWTAVAMGLLEFAMVGICLDVMLLSEGELASIRRRILGLLPARESAFRAPLPFTKGS